MNVSVSFLADLTVALAFATVLGVLAQRLRINPIIGYLAAGILIGRFTPGYVANAQTVETLAQLGLIFLLFSIGLGFSFGEVKALGARAIGGNLLVMAIGVAAAGAALTLLSFSHPWTAAIATSVSSTAVGVALLRGWRIETSVPGRFTIAQQIVQDLVAVALLVVATAPAESLSVAGIVLPVVKAALFVAAALVLGATVLHALVRRAVLHVESEVLIGLFSAVALVAAWLGYVVGLSFEFGAFVGGAVISEAAGSVVIASVVAPLRSLFVTLFFVSVGMLIDVSFLASYWPQIVAFGVALAIVRCGLWFALARADAMTVTGALFVGLGMASLGEFNVVLITEAERVHRLSGTETQILLAVTIVTMIVCVLPAPLLARMRGPLSERAVGVDGEAPPAARVAIVGYGRVGRTLAAVLERARVPYVAIEREREIVRRAREDGRDVILGDATDPLALDRLFAANVELLVLTLPESSIVDIIAQRIRAKSSAPIIARAERAADVGELQANGASIVLVPEVEGALSFADAALQALDVPAEEIDGYLALERAALRARSG